MISCHEVTRLAGEYLERRLKLRRRLGVFLHVLMCKGCRSYLEQLRLTLLALRAIPAPEVPPQRREELLRTFREHRGGR